MMGGMRAEEFRDATDGRAVKPFQFNAHAVPFVPGDPFWPPPSAAPVFPHAEQVLPAACICILCIGAYKHTDIHMYIYIVSLNSLSVRVPHNSSSE